MKNFDAIVLGAGILGVCTSLHLQLRGYNVCLVDRMAPGHGTSYGNAGLIERSSVIPYHFPRNFSRLVAYAFNCQTDVRFDWSYLLQIAPWLFQFWRQSSPKNLKSATEALLPLVENSVKEHDFLATKANATQFIAPNGWLEIYHTNDDFEKAKKQLLTLEHFHLNYDILDRQSLIGRVPAINEHLAGGVHWLDPKTVNDPAGLTGVYADFFVQQGGTFLNLDALKTENNQGLWSIKDDGHVITAPEIVVALGAQSVRFLNKFGYHHIPFAIKRGYHIHYRPMNDHTQLYHSICDPLSGFVLAPMRQGIRLTTGIEFARENAPAYWTQIKRAEKIARKIFPLGERQETIPWLGERPCLADMRPIIGRGPHHEGLWLNFGHAHHGLTLGAVSGKFLSQMMTGEQPLTSPDAFSLTRFTN
ncbi:FAD-binding oxidoreductase [uncultured Bartonella sp.]|uniref:NAD(P)/FAD-dependent oxidoreductase n=1 Tax=uncultured Bartonella sp. TaxID=104108 RepID=UPI0026353E55|nr:FAD-binding oxidoreductase [uncultured Bartonella sp.]